MRRCCGQEGLRPQQKAEAWSLSRGRQKPGLPTHLAGGGVAAKPPPACSVNKLPLASDKIAGVPVARRDRLSDQIG